MPKIGYRTDIDGLRAIAVLVVVLGHLDIRGFAGGYIGVDVFFVISGFLISKIVFGEIERGEFTFVRFYERRVRRILPALYVVIALNAILAFVTFMPGELKTFGRSVSAMTVFCSNMLFLKETGYFEPFANLKPLLHTWSLSVEEQFYIIYPLFLLLIAKMASRRWHAWLITAAAVSFLLNLALTAVDARAAFFLAPPRAWEFAVGAVLALGLPALNRAAGYDLVAGAGFVLLACCVALYSPAMVFPGAAAFCPCLAAGMILYGGECREGLAHRLLSLPPARFVGTVSYSFYLLSLAGHCLRQGMVRGRGVVRVGGGRSVRLCLRSGCPVLALCRDAGAPRRTGQRFARSVWIRWRRRRAVADHGPSYRGFGRCEISLT